MANDLTAVIPKLLAQGLLALRQNAITPRLVNRTYEALAGQRGSTIDVPIPSAITATTVTPSNSIPANVDVTPTSVPIPMTNWYESKFQLSDKDILQAMNGIIPMQASEAIKALANVVDSSILANYKSIYNLVGTPGTTPFASSVVEFTDSMVKLDESLCPPEDRRVLLSPKAQGNALKLPEFLRFDYRGDTGGIIRGQIGTKMGADWYMNQNVPQHTAGVPGGTPLVNGTGTLGASTIAIDGMTATTGTYKQGDVVTFAGDAQQYVITADVTASGTGTATLSVSPKLQTAVADNAAITLVASHRVNLQFHRDCFALASRPLADVADGLGNQILSMVDPVTQLVLRLEVSRQWRQTTFAYDILWGTAIIRPELGCRIAG